MAMADLLARARTIAADEDAGASEIAQALLPILHEALAVGPAATHEVVRAICAAQPGMAPIWHVCAAAIADLTAPGRFAHFEQAQPHYARAVVRVGADAIAELLTREPDARLVTWSYSATVAAVLARVAATMPLTVVCAEGRPRCEGRRLAIELAAAGARAIVATDAGASVDLERASAVVVGADAILATQWINKVGTRALAAAAQQVGCPLVVVATRDKAVPAALEGRLAMRAGRPADVWPDAPGDIEIATPVFERIPAELATWFATDVGLLTPSDLPTFTRRNEAEIAGLLEIL